MERTYTITVTANNIEEAHDDIVGRFEDARDSGIIEDFDINEMAGD